MILFRCKCGRSYWVEDRYAGSSVTCKSCGEALQVPLQSDPECLLIYRSGSSEEGIPMARADVERMLVSGELTPTDLVLIDDIWHPLMDLFAGLELPEPPIPPLEVDISKGEEPESVFFRDEDEDLNVIQKVLLESEAPSPRMEFPDARHHPLRAVREFIFGSRRSLAKLRVVWKAALVLVACFYAYKLGLGPLVSSYRKLPTYVAVYNGAPHPVIARLGWRRLKHSIPAGESYTFKTHVGMAEKQTLVVYAEDPELRQASDPIRIAIPMRPGGRTVAGAAATFGRFAPEQLLDKTFAGGLSELAREVCSNAEPGSALKVARDLRDFVRPAFKELRIDPVFRDTQYRFDPALFPEPEPPAGSDPAIPDPGKREFVVSPPTWRIPFRNGWAVYSQGDTDRLEARVALPRDVFSLSRTRVLKAGSPPHIEIRGNGDVLDLSVTLEDMSHVAHGKTFRGPWVYRASCPLSGSDRGRWTWNWQFRGQTRQGDRVSACTVDVGPSGEETLSFD